MQLAELDIIWRDCAQALGIPVQRGGDSYVHWDGRALQIADDSELDADDSLAQLILHEVCHWAVQGEAARERADWGLDNTCARDEVRERATMRLQAHLTASVGLRQAFAPTTPWKEYYAALPRAPLAERSDDAFDLAQRGAAVIARHPFAPRVQKALDASASTLQLLRHHKSEHVRDDSLRCGTCVWRTPGGLCRKAERRRFVAVDEHACAGHEENVACLSCAACCRSAYDMVTVGDWEPVRARHPELVVVRGEEYEVRRQGDRCAALGGDYTCAMYSDRPRTCREFVPLGRNCLIARRRVGLSL